jgi:tRNA-dihydrouridine synthase B
VIGNGDVVTVEDAKKLLEDSGADGVMIGRGAYGKPWLLNQAVHYLKTGTHLPDPSLQDQYDLIKNHLDSMIEHYGETTGVRIARKHLGWYSKGLHGSAEFRVLINQGDSSSGLHKLIDDFYLPLIQGHNTND